MSDLVVIVYPSEEKAEEVRKRLFELQKEYLIKLGDAVIATKSADGQIKLHQVVNTTAAGAVSGSFWGLLIGVLFLNPLLGAALGAAGGAVGGALTDIGIPDPFMKQLAESIKPGDAALFVLIQEMTSRHPLTRPRSLRCAMRSPAPSPLARRRPPPARPERCATPTFATIPYETDDCREGWQLRAARRRTPSRGALT